MSLIKHKSSNLGTVYLCSSFVKKLIYYFQGTWAGIDPILSYLDDIRPSPKISVCRFSHPIFSQLITEYVVAHVINSERGFGRKMVQAQTDKEWITEQASNHRPLKEIKIGILGVGQMGKSIAKMFKV